MLMIKKIEELITKLSDKIIWVKENNDVNYTGDIQEFRNGVIEGINFVLERLRELIK